ncbi:MAG: hypothetical protein WBP89_08825 [Sedimenticolaceae bacterium]|jgi:hypothetical protein
MTLDRMGATALDPETAREGGLFRLTIDGFTLMVVTDVPSGRMRAMISVSAAHSSSAAATATTSKASWSSSSAEGRGHLSVSDRRRKARFSRLRNATVALPSLRC